MEALPTIQKTSSQQSGWHSEIAKHPDYETKLEKIKQLDKEIQEKIPSLHKLLYERVATVGAYTDSYYSLLKRLEALCPENLRRKNHATN